MSIISKTATLKANSRSKRYEDMGYTIPKKEASELYKKRYNVEYAYDYGKPFEVKVEDLSPKSNAIIIVQCDNPNCKHIHSIQYKGYLKNINENNGKYFCKECWKERLAQRIYDKYGVDNISKLEEIKERKAQTTLKNYGYSHSFESPTILNNIIENQLAWTEESREKRIQTNLKKYNAENPLQNNEIKRKSCISFYKNNTVNTSKQQIYIHNLLGGELNGVVGHYNCDIVFEDSKTILEYNGGGHNLSVKHGEMTQEEFDQREIVRNAVIKREGYKTITIISSKDKLPSDLTLLQMLSYARTFFSTNPDRSWCTFDIDNGLFINKLNKETGGEPYDFGPLRTIKSKDITIQPQQEKVVA